MKKIISVLVALILVVGCMALTVSAAPSPEVDDVITIVDAKDGDGKDASIKLVKLDEMIDELKPTSADEAVVGQYEVVVEGSPKFPVSIEAELVGVKTTSTVYVLVKNTDGTIDKIPANVIADGRIKFEITSTTKYLSVITDKQTATNIGVSDKTGDSTSAVVMAVLCLAVAAAVVSAKKVNA